MHKNFTKNQETVSSYEGPQAYPKYDEKDYNSLNINERRHLFTKGQNVNLIKWESNLREYDGKSRKRILQIRSEAKDTNNPERNS